MTVKFTSIAQWTLTKSDPQLTSTVIYPQLQKQNESKSTGSFLITCSVINYIKLLAMQKVHCPFDLCKPLGTKSFTNLTTTPLDTKKPYTYLS